MMSFCRKSVHSFLGLNDLNCATTNNNYSSSSSSSFDEPKMSSSPTFTTTTPCKHGLGLITGDTGEAFHRSPPKVIESSIVKLLAPPVAAPVVMGVFSSKKDPGGIGFIDEVGGGVDGLMSCTESLGFESSDGRTVDDRIEFGTRVESSPSTSRAKWRKVGEKREIKKFPPPLSSFNHHGQPSFFLRPVRKNGRLELTEVRIDRPEILHACREDGRLRLHLIREADDFDSEFKEEEEEEEQNNQEIIQEEEEEEEEEEYQCNEDQEEEEELTEEENHDEEEETVGEWKFPVTGEGFRRCNEPTVAPDYHHRLHHHHHQHHHHNMSHHHNLHVWGQHYVTTR